MELIKLVDDQTEKKKRFALLVLKGGPKSHFQAALDVAKQDTATALQISSAWPRDPEVLQHMENLREELGEEFFLPTKAEAAKLVYDMAENPRLSFDDRLKALKLYADMRGFIERPNNVVNNNIVNSNKVMVVRDHGSDDDWEQRAAQHQSSLIEASYVATDD